MLCSIRGISSRSIKRINNNLYPVAKCPLYHLEINFVYIQFIKDNQELKGLIEKYPASLLIISPGFLCLRETVYFSVHVFFLLLINNGDFQRTKYIFVGVILSSFCTFEQWTFSCE